VLVVVLLLVATQATELAVAVVAVMPLLVQELQTHAVAVPVHLVAELLVLVAQES
jgi:glyceraldehyde-3-phosphate dehydrogenase/erythrose-4-phosphate dehydrogenase